MFEKETQTKETEVKEPKAEETQTKEPPQQDIVINYVIQLGDSVLGGRCDFLSPIAGH